MVKAPSSHGLARKFKPWRRGKSTNAKGSSSKTGASLKRQLRGLQRLYDEKTKQQDVTTDERRNDDDNPDPLKDLRSKIEDLQQQIASKNVSEKERVNATKSHKMRFVERQKTTRLYKNLQQQKMNQTVEEEFLKLALDQVYIAHYPLDHSSYLSLYHNNARRCNMNCRLLYKMAHQRKRVLDRLGSVERVNWIPSDQYERVLANLLARQQQQEQSWSTDLERTTFGITVTDAGTNNEKTTGTTTDKRFAAVSERAQKLVEEQDKMERDLAKNEQASSTEIGLPSNNNDETEEDESSSSEDDADPLTKTSPSTCATIAIKKSAANNVGSVESLAEDVGDSSSSDDDKEDTSRNPAQTNDGAVANDSDDDSTSSSSSSHGSSSSSSSSSSDDSCAPEPQKVEKPTTAKNKIATPPQPMQDDFFAAADDDVDVFANAKRHVPALNDAQGDKSKGWATQRQIPGQFRKKQRR